MLDTVSPGCLREQPLLFPSSCVRVPLCALSPRFRPPTPAPLHAFASLRTFMLPLLPPVHPIHLLPAPLRPAYSRFIPHHLANAPGPFCALHASPPKPLPNTRVATANVAGCEPSRRAQVRQRVPALCAAQAVICEPGAPPNAQTPHLFPKPLPDCALARPRAGLWQGPSSSMVHAGWMGHGARRPRGARQGAGAGGRRCRRSQASSASRVLPRDRTGPQGVSGCEWAWGLHGPVA